MLTTCARALLALAMVACSSYPPSDSAGAEGALGGRPFCTIYPSSGYASIDIDDSYYLEVELPPVAGVWAREIAYLSYHEDSLCYFALDGTVVRVQYGADPILEPDCDQCLARYRPLFIEHLDFTGRDACSSCDATDCRPISSTSADQLYLWCDSPEDAPP